MLVVLPSQFVTDAYARSLHSVSTHWSTPLTSDLAGCPRAFRCRCGRERVLNVNAINVEGIRYKRGDKMRTREKEKCPCAPRPTFHQPLHSGLSSCGEAGGLGASTATCGAPESVVNAAGEALEGAIAGGTGVPPGLRCENRGLAFLVTEKPRSSTGGSSTTSSSSSTFFFPKPKRPKPHGPRRSAAACSSSSSSSSESKSLQV